jgi:hypothetical protein
MFSVVHARDNTRAEAGVGAPSSTPSLMESKL